jgi:hypothetical protein
VLDPEVARCQHAGSLGRGGLEKIGARPPRLNWAERQHLARDPGASVPGCSDDECQLNDVNVTGSIAVNGL